eukprot:gene15139-biopygen2138
MVAPHPRSLHSAPAQRLEEIEGRPRRVWPGSCHMLRSACRVTGMWAELGVDTVELSTRRNRSTRRALDTDKFQKMPFR